MNKVAVIVVVVIILAGAAYVGRHSLKQMFMGQPAMTTSSTQAPTSASPSSAMMPGNNIYMSKTDSVKGGYLTDFQGITLYTFDKDTTGVSNCTGSCATNWPPYTSGAVAQKTFPTNISVITRTDGTQQFAWKGMPLYYYAGDKKAGDLNGDGVGGIWHIVKQ